MLAQIFILCVFFSKITPQIRISGIPDIIYEDLENDNTWQITRDTLEETTDTLEETTVTGATYQDTKQKTEVEITTSETTLQNTVDTSPSFNYGKSDFSSSSSSSSSTVSSTAFNHEINTLTNLASSSYPIPISPLTETVTPTTPKPSPTSAVLITPLNPFANDQTELNPGQTDLNLQNIIHEPPTTVSLKLGLLYSYVGVITLLFLCACSLFIYKRRLRVLNFQLPTTVRPAFTPTLPRSTATQRIQRPRDPPPPPPSKPSRSTASADVEIPIITINPSHHFDEPPDAILETSL